MATDYYVKVGDGENFKNSSKLNIFGLHSKSNLKLFNNVKPGDRLWFTQGESKGKLIGIAIYRSHNIREIGPLMNITMSNEELGWNDIEIHYSDLNDFHQNNCNLLISIVIIIIIKIIIK